MYFGEIIAQHMRILCHFLRTPYIGHIDGNLDCREQNSTKEKAPESLLSGANTQYYCISKMIIFNFLNC